MTNEEKSPNEVYADGENTETFLINHLVTVTKQDNLNGINDKLDISYSLSTTELVNYTKF